MGKLFLANQCYLGNTDKQTAAAAVAVGLILIINKAVNIKEVSNLLKYYIL